MEENKNIEKAVRGAISTTVWECLLGFLVLGPCLCWVFGFCMGYYEAKTDVSKGINYASAWLNKGVAGHMIGENSFEVNEFPGWNKGYKYYIMNRTNYGEMGFWQKVSGKKLKAR